MYFGCIIDTHLFELASIFISWHIKKKLNEEIFWTKKNGEGILTWTVYDLNVSNGDTRS